MATKHRKRGQAAKRFATMGAATATAAVLTASMVSPAQQNAPVNPLIKVQHADSVRLAAIEDLLPLSINYFRANLAALGIGSPVPGGATQGSPGLPSMPLAPGAPDPALIPDLTFGLGTQAYGAFQSVGAQLETFLVNAFDLSAVLQALGVDPASITASINTALGGLLTSALGSIPIDLSGVDALLGAVLSAAGVDNAADLLTVLGFDLADPLDLNGVSTPGINIITAGPPFTLLKLLGIDLGWVPGFPNSVADEINNNTPYLDVGAINLLTTLRNRIPADSVANIALRATLAGLITGLGVTGDIDIVQLRVPIVAGFGLGAFAAGMAYPEVVAQLPYQPGGALYDGDSDPMLGSFTILPMILLRNPGRANGGLFARFYPLAALFGIDTVTPDTEVSSSGEGLGISLLGLTLGGANLIPIKVDATVEYDPLSDFPAWPNPFSLANSAAAAVFPTYILRGFDLTTAASALLAQAAPQLAAGLASDPLALNLYLTLPTNALPLLEPVRLPIDVINLISPVKFNNPLATALEPALKILVNLGYTDVDQSDDYNRTLDMANVITQFGTLPSGVDWWQVPADVFDAFVMGVQQAVADGLIATGTPDNPLATAAGLFGLTDASGTLQLSSVANLVNNMVGGGVSGLSTLSPSPAGGQLPDANTPDLLGSLNDILSQTAGSLGLGLQSVAAGNAQLSQAKTIQAGLPEVAMTPAILDNFESPLSGATVNLKERAEALKLSGVDAEVNLRKAGKQLSDAADVARDQADKSLKRASKRLNDIAEKGRKDIERAVKDADTQAKKSVAKLKAVQKRAQDKPTS